MSTLQFTKGKRGSANALYDGYRYSLDNTRNDRRYWRCVNRASCKGRLVTVGDSVTNTPQHSHPPQDAEIDVHLCKQNLKSMAATSHLSTKEMVAESMSTLNFEGRSKLNCQLNSLSEMARLSRQRSMNYPANPTSLADLAIPPHLLKSRAGDDMLLWDSGYTPELRRSLLFGTKSDVDMLHLSDHLLIDGTFKSSPDMFTQLVVTHGLMEDGWRCSHIVRLPSITCLRAAGLYIIILKKAKIPKILFEDNYITSSVY